MKGGIYLVLAGLFILIASVVAHPRIISFADSESYGVSRALCLSDLGNPFNAQIEGDCSRLGIMENLVLAARVGWVAGVLVVGAGIWLIARSAARKPVPGRNKNR
ncbi:MAG: hypothetical protein V1820_01355 [archaeon]